MDNQQATSWFVGILEGEGSFSKSYHNGTRVRISNTEIDLIEKCKEILLSWSILGKVSSWQRGKRKREYELIVQGKFDCQRLFMRIEKSLQCRLQEYKQILESSETTCEVSSDLYWLIGILEAEASFHISCHMSRNNESNYAPEIAICNTNFAIISKVVKTIHSLNLSWHVQQNKTANPKHSEYKVVTIRGYKRVFRALSLFEGLWVSKRVDCKSKLVLEFCRSRLNDYFEKRPYTQREHEIFHMLRRVI